MNSREFELEQARKLLASGKLSEEAREVLEKQFPELREYVHQGRKK